MGTRCFNNEGTRRHFVVIVLQGCAGGFAGRIFFEDATPLTPAGTVEGTSISTSSAQNDAGIFEFNFRDERYLPFEGAGAVSEWSLELPRSIRTFDYDTISDVIIHISYTAKEDAGFRTEVEGRIESNLTDIASTDGLYRLFSLRHEFPTAFHQLLNPAPETPQTTEFGVTKQHFPYFLVDRVLALSEVKVYLKPRGTACVSTDGLTLNLNDSDVTGWLDLQS